MTIPALSSQYEVTDKRDIIVKSDGVLAFGAMR
jgi:hypothetical protein